MDILKLAASMLGDKLGIDSNLASIGLRKLFGGNDGGFDVGSLLGSMQQGGLSDAVSSWLGDGENMSLDPAALQSSLGVDKITDAADSMGVSTDLLISGLSGVIPGVVDQASSGGSLLDSVGEFGGVADLAKKLF